MRFPMLIRILQTFVDVASPRPILADELLDVPETLAVPWVTKGLAESYSKLQIFSETPRKAKREKAIRP